MAGARKTIVQDNAAIRDMPAQIRGGEVYFCRKEKNMPCDEYGKKDKLGEGKRCCEYLETLHTMNCSRHEAEMKV